MTRYVKLESVIFAWFLTVHPVLTIAVKSTNSETTREVELDATTFARLEERGQIEGDETINDVVSRHLNQTCVSISLNEFIEQIVGDTETLQITASKGSTDPLNFFVYTKTEMSDDLFAGVHAIEVNGRLHRFRLEAIYPQTEGRVTVFIEEPLQDTDGNPGEGSIQRLEAWISHQLKEPEGEQRA